MILWAPFSGMQEDYLRALEFEVFIGGAAGPGKSDALVIKRLRNIHNGRYRGLILRASFPELQELIDRSHEIFPHFGGQWNENEKRWTFPSGATYEFGYLKTFLEVQRYRGQEYTTIDYDEIGDLAEFRAWIFLATRCRTKSRNLRPQMGCSANPGGVAHIALKKRYVDTCGEDGARVFKDPATGHTRRFIPGRVRQNPVLMANNPLYIANLRLNSEMIRRQLEDGDWSAGSGSALEEMAFHVHVIEPFKVPKYWRTWGAFDWGFAHPWAYGLFAYSEDGDLYLVESVIGRRLLDQEICDRIHSVLDELVVESPATGETYEMGYMLPRVTAAGHDCWSEIRSRSEQGPTTYDTFVSNKIPLVQANISRVDGLKTLRNYVAWRKRGANGEDGRPRFFIFDTDTNRKVYACLEGMISDPDNPEDALKVDADEDGEGGDDPYDMVRYGAMQRPLLVKKPEQKKLHAPSYDPVFDRMMKAREKAQKGGGRGF